MSLPAGFLLETGVLSGERLANRLIGPGEILEKGLANAGGNASPRARNPGRRGAIIASRAPSLGIKALQRRAYQLTMIFLPPSSARTR